MSGNIYKRKRHLFGRLRGIQNIIASSAHRGLFKLEQKLRRELELVLEQEELFWF